MSGPVEAIIVGKWSVGLAGNNNMTILHFEFTDRAPLTLALPLDQAAQIAAAIQSQQKSPPEPTRMN
jgi:hypothetical protein